MSTALTPYMLNTPQSIEAMKPVLDRVWASLHEWRKQHPPPWAELAVVLPSDAIPEWVGPVEAIFGMKVAEGADVAEPHVASKGTLTGKIVVGELRWRTHQ